MRILQINNEHFVKGGAHRVYFNTIDLLRKNGHEVIEYCTNHPDNEASRFIGYFAKYTDYRNQPFIKKLLGVPGFLNNKQAKANLIKLVRHYRPDIAHLHLFYGGLSSSILSGLSEEGIPIVMSVHDYRLLCPASVMMDGNNNICELCRDRHYYRIIGKKCEDGSIYPSAVLAAEAYLRKYLLNPLDYVKAFIFVSKYIMQKHVEYDGKYSGKSYQLYNFGFYGDNIKKTGENSDYILFYGRLEKEKGVMTLIDALQGTNIRLKIAGNGALKEKVKDMQSGNVEYVGYKQGKELTQLVGEAKFIVVPSEWYENNPMTIIEAYFHGKPVIAARIGGIPEIVEEGRTGFLFDSGNVGELRNTLIRASALPARLYNEMSINSRMFAERMFDPGKHYEKLMHIYDLSVKGMNAG